MLNVLRAGEELPRTFCMMFYLRFFVSNDQCIKWYVVNILLAVWEKFLYENTCNYQTMIGTRIICKKGIKENFLLIVKRNFF